MVLFITGILMDLSVAIKQVTVSVTTTQLEVSVAIMQVAFSAVHYAHDCFCRNYPGQSFFYSYVGDSFK